VALRLIERLLRPVLSNWPLIAVAVWGIYVANKTLRAIARQADIMEAQTRDTAKSADAALLNAKTAINAERAWVFSTMEKLGDEMFVLRITNHGKTPAEVINITQQETWTDLTDPTLRELPTPRTPQVS
jgi:hypothetical protein